MIKRTKKNAENEILLPAEMSPEQLECYQLICDLVGGEHHLNGHVRRYGVGIRWNTKNFRFSTFDFSELTNLVVMCHDRCIRAEIVPSGPAVIGIALHKRKGRDGGMWERHPTLEDHVAILRGEK